MILTSQWPDVYGNLMVDWGESYETYTPVGEQLLKKRQDRSKTGKLSDADFFGLAPDLPEGSAFAEEDPVQGYAITWEQSAIGKGITLTHEDFLFEQTLSMSEKVRGLALTTRLRREHDIAMRLRYGSATTFSNPSGNTTNIAVADTKALIADDHPIPNSSAVNDNDLDGVPFNRANLVVALNKFPTFKNNKALKINGLRPTHIITSDDYQITEAVQAEIGSPMDATTANHRINPITRLGLQHIQIPGLQQDGTGSVDTTGRYYWFVACLPMTDMFMLEAESDTPVFPKFDMSNPNDPITGNHKVTVRGTYAIVTRRYHWITGSYATTLG